MIARHNPILSLHPIPIPRIKGRGRKKGSGSNLEILSGMRPKYPMMGIPLRKMESIRGSARRAGIPIMVRQDPTDSRKYLIFKK